MRFYKLPGEIARAAIDIWFGLPASAGHDLDRRDLDLKAIEDLTVARILGTLSGLEEQFGD